MSSGPARSAAQWRSLEAMADTPAFQRLLAEEFPAVTDLSVGPERRSFLKLMAASLMLAGLAGCDDPPDGRSQEVPYVKDPPRQQPGASLSYASAALVDGLANGVLVTTRDGRPLKIEGNPEHPWSRGGTDVFGQASILGLYDPNRSQVVRHLGRTSTWDAFRGAAIGPFAAFRANGGKRLRLLTGPLSSPSLLAQVAAIRAACPDMQWHSHAAVDRSTAGQGARRAFGRPLDTQYRFDRARVIVALDGDFLDPGPHQVGVSRAWSAARRASGSGKLLELYAAGSLPNLTLAKADHPLVAKPQDIAALAQTLLADATAPDAPVSPAGSDALTRWRAGASAALHGARGAGLVIAGPYQPAEVQEAAHRLNTVLGNLGQTVFHTPPAVAPAGSLSELAEAMGNGEVDALVMLGTNPVYDAPGSLRFADLLAKVPLKIHAGIHQDETALRSDWHLPLLHPLESWGDARSPDGTVSLMQPTVAPLYDGRSAAEILSVLFDQQPRSGLDLLRAHWMGSEIEAAFAPKWETMLRDGFVPDSAFPPETVALAAGASDASPTPASPEGLTVLFRPDATVWDGAAADNAWLQELPKPLTKLVWENAITVAPALAARQGLSQGDVVTVEAEGRGLEGPVWILPGQADGVVGVTLGYGREVPDRIAYKLGYDANALRNAASPWQLAGATLTKTGRSIRFATTQDHGTMEGHDFVRVQRVGEAAVGETASWTQPTLYPSKEGDGRAWGMVIDLDSCIGCNACVTACQAENNIAVVGREQVAMGREMHWLRVDRYYEGPTEAPRTRFQPVPCMHCEKAPCEVGCPVEATLHDQEGLNLMVYNRCVGTRACSGYCPYKVRHFNYLDYSAGAAPSIALQRNPEVTVRARGVMEKCTYCVQRIASARIESDKTGAPIADGRVQTACQSACPTQAITFGNLNDRASAVAAARQSPRNYALLGELNVRPRTTYLAVLQPAPDDDAS